MTPARLYLLAGLMAAMTLAATAGPSCTSIPAPTITQPASGLAYIESTVKSNGNGGCTVTKLQLTCEDPWGGSYSAECYPGANNVYNNNGLCVTTWGNSQALIRITSFSGGDVHTCKVSRLPERNLLEATLQLCQPAYPHPLPRGACY